MSATALLWFGVLGGMAAWAAHLVVSYAAVELGCAALGEVPVRVSLIAVTVATGVIALAALLVARQTVEIGTTWRRSLARAGMLLDGLGLVGIAVAGTLPFALTTC